MSSMTASARTFPEFARLPAAARDVRFFRLRVGQIDAFNIGLLQQKGSLFATRPVLFHYIAKREDLDEMAHDLFKVVLSGEVKIPIHARFPLAEAAEAHRALESRETIGSTILLP